jgi:hypothetical protein
MDLQNRTIVPEIAIFDSIKKILAFIRNDFKSKPNEQDTLLYKMVQDNTLQRYNLFNEAKTVFLEAKNHNEPRFLDVNMGYNFDRINKNNPTIHILMQGDSPRDNSMGYGLGNNPIDYNDQEGTYQEYYERHFDQRLNLMVSSDNVNEKILIFYILRSMLISLIPYLNGIGLHNVSFSGADIVLNSGPAGNITMRNLSMSFDYDVVSPSLIEEEFVRDLFFQLTIKQDGKEEIQ